MQRERVLEEKPLDMRLFDPMNIVHIANDVLLSLRNKRRRLILKNFIRQAKAEACGDVDSMLACCSRNQASYSERQSTGVNADWCPQSYEELKTHYRQLIKNNAYLVHIDVERFLVADDEVVVDGIVHQLYQGDRLGIFGIDVEKPDTVFQLTKRTLIISAFDAQGQAAGEAAYTNGAVCYDDFSPVPEQWVPEQFWHNPMTGTVMRQRQEAALTQ